MLRIAPRRRSAFFSVSCPAAFACVAAGQQGARSLIERWKGTKWSAQAVPATVKPLTTDLLFHVSCVTPSICTAVGYRHNPAARNVKPRRLQSAGLHDPDSSASGLCR